MFVYHASLLINLLLLLLLLWNVRKVPRVKSEEESRKSRRLLNAGGRTSHAAWYDTHDDCSQCFVFDE